MYNIEVGLVGTGFVDVNWIKVAKDRVKLMALVVTVLRPW